MINKEPFNAEDFDMPSLKWSTGDEVSAFCEALRQHYGIVRGGGEWIQFLTTFQSQWYACRHLKASEFAAKFHLDWIAKNV